MADREQIYLRQCRHLIESRLAWGSAEEWTNQDFLRLSELIFDETSVNLSITTLKRLWGKVKYNSQPNVSTLNVLARFAGYPHWRAFKMANAAATEEPKSLPFDVQEKPSSSFPNNFHIASFTHVQDRKVILRSFTIALILLLVGCTLIGFMFSITAHQKSLATLDQQTYSFSAKPITTGVPNTIIFDYDTSTAPSDSIAIQLSRNSEQKAKVSSKDHRYTSMYYYPGVYHARLLVDNEVVGQQAFLINTRGWLAMVEHEPVPFYFEEDIFRQGSMRIPWETLQDSAFNTPANTPWVSYYNVGNFEELYSDDFVLETELKSDFKQGDAVCQDSSLVILYDNAPPLTIPLTIPGCLAKLDKHLKTQEMPGDNVNLLAFGVNFSDWVKIKCEASTQQFRLLINEELAYQGDLPEKSSKIVGIAYRFHGTGSVNYLSLSQSDGKQVYFEDFEG